MIDTKTKTGAAPTSTGDCLDIDQLAAFAAGRLDDAALREVDAHLDACSACLDLVAMQALPPAAPIAVHTPVRLGRYRIEERMGSGALGVVYAAVDETLDRRVALKLLRPDKLDPDGTKRKRLLREARALARLDHPNAVGVYDAGEVDGTGFVAMRLVQGRTLRQHCRALPWPAVLDCYLAAARGLIAAHDVGLVHRDFKPDNVLIDDDGGVFVCDFGLAGWSPNTATTQTASSDDGDLTATGHTPGTPRYMAPELWDGELASPASDQFAFCVALWEDLAGRPPFDATSRAELREQLRQPPPGLHLRAAGVPPGVVAAIVRGLAVDPKARHESVRALHRTLIRARRRRRIVRAALGIGVLSLTTALLAVAPTPPADPCAVPVSRTSAPTLTRTDLPAKASEPILAALGEYAERFVAAEDELCRTRLSGRVAPAIDHCLDGRLAAYDQLVTTMDELPATVLSAQGLAAVNTLQAPETCLERDSARSNWTADAEVRARLGPTVLVADRVLPLMEVGVVEQARAQLDAALIELEAEPPSSYLVEARLARLGIEEVSGRPVAEDAYDALVELATAHDDLTLAARLWSRRLGSAANRGAMEELPTLLDTAKWAFDVAGRPEQSAAGFHEASGFAAMRLGRMPLAVSHVQAAIDNIHSREGPTNPKLAELRGAMAMLAYQQGQVSDAVVVATQAWEDLQPAVSPGFAALPRMALNLATFHADLQHPEQAVEWARRGLLEMERGSNTDPVLRGALVEIIVLHDEIPEALAAAEALIVSSQALDPYVRGRAFRTAARGAKRAERLAKASAHLDAADADFEAAGATGDMIAVRYDRALIALQRREFEVAATLLADVIAHEETIPGFDDALRVVLRAKSAEVALERGRMTQAARMLAKAREAMVGVDSPALLEQVEALGRRVEGSAHPAR